ncbi:MAG TPA: efflux RND transporter periplasmic adaptor subunit [Nitrospinaceae bacterium]|jgi:RND family efflux transporter MFP subunit|nr:efflux RND transporter periplasmic adaptor subunit [Nitrospinaceae bacterium]
MATIITKFLSMVRISFLSIFIIQTIFFVFSGCAKKEEVAKKKREFSLPVQIGKIIVKDVTDQVRVVGNIRAEQRVTINAEVEGQIKQVKVEEGDEVAVGDLLARIDSREYELEVEELEAELSAAKEEFKKAIEGLRPEEKEKLLARVRVNESAFDLAIKEQDRFQKLVKDGVTAQSILDEVNDRVQQAKEKLRESRATFEAAKQSRQEDIQQLRAEGEGIVKRLEMAQLNFSKTLIHAPFDGVIVHKKIEEGAFLKVGSPVFEMISSSRLKAVLEIPQSHRNKLKKLKGIDFWVKELGLKFKQSGKLRVIPDADIYSGNIRAQMELHRPNRALFPGLTLVGMMNFGVRKNVMHVPSVALVISEKGTVVYVVKESKAHLVPVRAYKERNELIEIDDFTNQLSPDSELILRGSGAVFPGAKVFPTNLESEARTDLNTAPNQNENRTKPDQPET